MDLIENWPKKIKHDDNKGRVTATWVTKTVYHCYPPGVSNCIIITVFIVTAISFWLPSVNGLHHYLYSCHSGVDTFIVTNFLLRNFRLANLRFTKESKGSESKLVNTKQRNLSCSRCFVFLTSKNYSASKAVNRTKTLVICG